MGGVIRVAVIRGRATSGVADDLVSGLGRYSTTRHGTTYLYCHRGRFVMLSSVSLPSLRRLGGRSNLEYWGNRVGMFYRPGFCRPTGGVVMDVSVMRMGNLFPRSVYQLRRKPVRTKPENPHGSLSMDSFWPGGGVVRERHYFISSGLGLFSSNSAANYPPLEARRHSSLFERPCVCNCSAILGRIRWSTCLACSV